MNIIHFDEVIVNTFSLFFIDDNCLERISAIILVLIAPWPLPLHKTVTYILVALILIKNKKKKKIKKIRLRLCIQLHSRSLESFKTLVITLWLQCIYPYVSIFIILAGHRLHFNKNRSHDNDYFPIYFGFQYALTISGRLHEYNLNIFNKHELVWED